MRPKDLKTKIFLDSGDPKETQEALRILGFLDGQTTNPSLISKNPAAQKKLQQGEKFSEIEALVLYKDIVKEIFAIIPDGSISIEVYADRYTKARDMLQQAQDMSTWASSAHIKFPITHEGLKAAKKAIRKNIKLNMTLCFTQEQAAAVYSATKGAKAGDVYVSPFIGRLDGKGMNGMDLISNILRMYQGGDGHVYVLTSSVRKLEHFLYALSLGSDIITAPFKILQEWVSRGMPVPQNYQYSANDLKSIPYQIIDILRSWRNHNIFHELTDAGVEKFASDWKSLIRS